MLLLSPHRFAHESSGTPNYAQHDGKLCSAARDDATVGASHPNGTQQVTKHHSKAATQAGENTRTPRNRQCSIS